MSFEKVNYVDGRTPIGAKNLNDIQDAILGTKTANGTVVSQNADFAEVAEWADGNPSKEDRTGYFVCANVPLDGIVMRKATSIDDVKGVSIQSPAFAGNYTKDKLDSEGNLLPKYSFVAILGFVPVIDNGTCTVGGRCMPDDNGCAVPSSNSMGYQVVNRIDENRVLIIIEPNGDMVQRIKSDVNKTVRYIDTKTLKVEENVITNDNVAPLGAGWSGNLVSGFSHAEGSTEPLTFNIGANDGEKYLIRYDWDLDDNPRAITLKLGSADNIDNVYATDPYVYGDIKWGLRCVGNNGVLQIIPSDTYKGTIKNIKLQKISDSGTEEVEITLENIETIPLENHLTGFYNISLGKNALTNSINTTRCLAIGGDSLRELKTGGRNICLGTYALSQMEYGENNISFGADSGFAIKEAQDCIVIGKGAMSYGKKVSNNIAIGPYALYGGYEKKDSTASQSNIAIGQAAGYYNTGKYNVFIGDKAGYNNESMFGTFIGADAGGQSTGHSNTCIGLGSDVLGADSYGGYRKSTAIGYNAKATKNDQVVIGGDDVVETLLKGNLVVRGTDGVYRQIIFNADGSCSWETITI